MTMTGRYVDKGICILAAVALLAVMAFPIPFSRGSHTAPPPNYLPRNFGIIKFGHSGRVDSLQSFIEDELDADIEDELTVTSPLASVYFNGLPSPCPEPYSELVSFAVAIAARPLRC